jgi:hypothetical protein
MLIIRGLSRQPNEVKGLYAFRINDQYRARLVKLDEETYFILVVGDVH